MRVMGLQATVPGPHTSKPHPDHVKYPYLLRGMAIGAPCEVWSADITYIPMQRGFMFLVAVIDWFSRHVLAWDVSNSLESGFCVATLKRALKKGCAKASNAHLSPTVRTPQCRKCKLSCRYSSNVPATMKAKSMCSSWTATWKRWRVPASTRYLDASLRRWSHWTHCENDERLSDNLIPSMTRLWDTPLIHRIERDDLVFSEKTQDIDGHSCSVVSGTVNRPNLCPAQGQSSQIHDECGRGRLRCVGG